MPISFSVNVFKRAAAWLELLGPAADFDLGAAGGGLGLDHVHLRPGGSLGKVGLGEILDQLVERFPGFGVPAGVHQEADDALPFLLVLLIDAAEQAGSRPRGGSGWLRPGPARTRPRHDTSPRGDRSRSGPAPWRSGRFGLEPT